MAWFTKKELPGIPVGTEGFYDGHGFYFLEGTDAGMYYNDEFMRQHPDFFECREDKDWLDSEEFTDLVDSYQACAYALIDLKNNIRRNQPNIRHEK